MLLSSNFEKQLKLIARFNGKSLTLEERLNLKNAFAELYQKFKPELLYFWGRINCEGKKADAAPTDSNNNNYYIALGINFKDHYGFPLKTFYFCTSSNFSFEELPETFPYHDKDINDYYDKPLTGNPNYIIKKYKQDANLDDNKEPEENKEDEEKKPQKLLDPDASVDDNPPKIEEPKENFIEKFKLSYLVRKIDYDTFIFPLGMYKLNSKHEIFYNKNFKGLNKNDIKKINSWMHLRPVSEEKKKFIEEADAIFSDEIFDSIVNDKVKNCWSFVLDTTKTICNLRSLLWPGYYAAHQGESNLACGVYFGNGQKNLELPFMV